MDRVVRVTASLGTAQHAAIQRCVELMCYGMPRFQFNASLKGLARSSDLDDYCYYVAGVVGEMLTDLFCDYSVDIAAPPSCAQCPRRVVRSGPADDEYSQGCLGGPQPRRLLVASGSLHAARRRSQHCRRADRRIRASARVSSELVGVAHAHLRNALDYTLLIPAKERGIRRFCLWAIGLAVLTLRKIAHNPGFTAGAQVKIRRSAVSMTLLLTNLAVTNDWVLRRLFAWAARGLPLARLPDIRRPRVALVKSENHADIEPQRTRLRSYGSSGS